ncbi:hypothetical protein [Microvirga sp. TS319]|uniref:hypothetical protein n=1 Tax=Microvirga sp. TS319 TaxID=3241165 RepID=UPI00351A1675
MIIALLALAFAMIVGGLLAAFFGWDIVLIERGWTMVIAGSFSAACGALLLGITAAVSKLARIQSELARLQIGYDEAVRDEASASTNGLSAAALAGGLLGGRMFGRGGTAEPEAAQPDLPLFPQGEGSEPAAGSRAEADGEKAGETRPSGPTVDDKARPEEDEFEVKVPDFLLAERREETTVELRDRAAETSLFADEPKLAEPEEEHRDERERDEPREIPAGPLPAVEQDADTHGKDIEAERGLEPFSGGEKPAAALEEEVAEEKAGEEKAGEAPRPGATVVGTYNSGDNTYVMFSDGSIEAQTPKGVFHFQSLDELKAFIASGGEGESSVT